MMIIIILIYLLMGVVRRGDTISAQSQTHNRFATKNSYDASLELWPDTEHERLRACCRPIQVMY